MIVETGKLYEGEDGICLVVLAIDGEQAIVQKPSSLREQIMPLADLQAWAVAETTREQRRTAAD